MAVCVGCGTDNPDHHRFCSRCGARIRPEQPPKAAEPPASPELAERLLDQAFQYSDEGRLAEAIKAAERAVNANPNSTSAHSLLGILYERAGQRQSAIKQYERALSLSPRSTADREALRQLVSTPGARGRPPVVRAVIFGTFILACGLLVAGIGLVLRTGPGAKPVIAGTEPGQIAPALGGFPIPPGGMPSGTTLPQAPTTAQPRPAQPARSVAVPEAAPVPQQRPAARAIDMQAALRQAPSPTVRTRPLATPRPVQYPAPQPLPDTPRRVPPPIALRQAPAPAPQPVQPSSVPTQQAARAYYFQRDYPKAIDAYESLLSANRDSRASVREELAWCYYQMSRPDDSIAQYRSALAAYEKELAAPETRDEAEHGIRTCQAALEALGAR